jgi:hypothetical protein
MPRIPNAGRDVPDADFDFLKKVYKRSGADVGPRAPMSEDMKRRINADMDKMGIGGKKTYGGGGSGGASSDAREMQLGSELDPKAMMRRKDKKAEGGTIKASKMGAVKQGKPSMGSASKRADGIAQRGKTKGRMV